MAFLLVNCIKDGNIKVGKLNKVAIYFIKLINSFFFAV